MSLFQQPVKSEVFSIQLIIIALHPSNFLLLRPCFSWGEYKTRERQDQEEGRYPRQGNPKGGCEGKSKFAGPDSSN
jgi:hypothetical protein